MNTSTDIPLAERRYELLRDIVLPNQYVRAGVIKTGAEWAKLGYMETWVPPDKRWFANTTPEPETHKSADARLRGMCREVLAEHGLHSLTFLDAAVKCVMTDRQNRQS